MTLFAKFIFWFFSNQTTIWNTKVRTKKEKKWDPPKRNKKILTFSLRFGGTVDHLAT